MHNLSGIKPSQNLLQRIPAIRAGNDRLILVKIANESFEIDRVVRGGPSWQEDYVRLLPLQLSDLRARYVFFKLGSERGFVFLTWIPDNINVRERMIYASSKLGIRNVFGSSSIIDQLLFNSKDQLPSLDDFVNKYSESPVNFQHSQPLETSTPRPSAAAALANAFKGEQMQFRFDNRLENAVEMFRSAQLNALTMSVHPETELITLKWTCPHRDLANICKLIHISRIEGQFHLIRSLEYNKVIFVFSIPIVSDVSVRNRMMCSSAVKSTYERIRSMGIDVTSRIEVSTKEELENALIDLGDVRRSSLVPLTTFNRPIARSRRRDSDLAK